ncbi:MAG: helix-turn-helix domain-containing protein [Myxococcota bacterium]
MSSKTREKRGRKAAPPRSSRSAPPPAPSSSDRRTITARELAALLGLDRKTVYEGAARGEIPSVRVGRRILFSVAAIDAWLSDPSSGSGILGAPSCSSPREVTRP